MDRGYVRTQKRGSWLAAVGTVVLLVVMWAECFRATVNTLWYKVWWKCIFGYQNWNQRSWEATTLSILSLWQASWELLVVGHSVAVRPDRRMTGLWKAGELPPCSLSGHGFFSCSQHDLILPRQDGWMVFLSVHVLEKERAKWLVDCSFWGYLPFL